MMFDVDCPSTPDSDEQLSKTASSKPSNTVSASKPPLQRHHSQSGSRGSSIPRPSGTHGGRDGRPSGRSPPSPRGRSADALTKSSLSRSRSHSHSTHQHSHHNHANRAQLARSRSKGSRLEPEERVVIPSAPSSGPSGLAYGSERNNPFASVVEFSKSEDGGMNGGNRRRTHSDNWWKEEITEEKDDKKNAMENYYGLNKKDKESLYGKSPAISAKASKNPFEDKATPVMNGRKKSKYTYGAGVALGIGYNGDGSVESALVDIVKDDGGENGNSNGYQAPPPPPPPSAMVGRHHGQQNAQHSVQQGQHAPQDNMSQSLYQQASQARNNGYYHEDDYSFSVIDLPPPVNNSRASRSGGSPGAGAGKMFQMPKWFSGFAPGANHPSATNNANIYNGSYAYNSNPYSSTTMTPQTNLAPPLRGSSHDWWAASPKVTFDTDIHGRKKSKWARMSPHQKMGMAVIWVGLMCTIMGVTVSELKHRSSSAEREGGASGSTAATGVMTLGVEIDTEGPTVSPTETPTFFPTLRPTPNPTRLPTKNPVVHDAIEDGVVGVHEKQSFGGTPRPTQSPIKPPTDHPTKSPTTSPTSSPTASPVAVELVQASPGSHHTSASSVAGGLLSQSTHHCTDLHGEFKNHLDNPKTCEWLNNGGKEGFTDRKNKNCGTDEYPITELGQSCQAGCKLYNVCGSLNHSSLGSGSAGSSGFESVMVPNSSSSSGGSTSVKICTNMPGMYKNHLGTPKDCAWLYNGKEGRTDRKDKNCGFGDYEITELGRYCPDTCVWYNGDGCSIIQVAGSINVRSSSTSDWESALTSSTACINGSGHYLDHLGNSKSCQWLLDPDEAESRQKKNCGTQFFPLTQLGKECPWSCKKYNGCDYK